MRENNAFILLFLLCIIKRANCQGSIDIGSKAGNLVLNIFLSIILLCFSALFSGLTLGMLGLDQIGLQVSN